VELLLAGEIEPTDAQRGQLEGLLGEYARAVQLVNAETMKRRLSPTDLRNWRIAGMKEGGTSARKADTSRA